MSTSERKFFKEIIKNLGFDESLISERIAIVSPDLANKASYFLKSSPKLDIKKLNESKEKFTARFYQKLLTRFSWNNKDFVNYPVLPAFYICEEKDVDEIASNGFANVPARREYFGEGYYFTTSPSRIIPMLQDFERPVIFICFTFPGNPYFITKAPALKNNLFDKKIISGFNSHYALVNEKGLPIGSLNELVSLSEPMRYSNTDDQTEPLLGTDYSSVDLGSQIEKVNAYHDELIIPEKSEILPIFLLRLKDITDQKIN
jgi:hypothetical protein